MYILGSAFSDGVMDIGSGGTTGYSEDSGDVILKG
jgi:hypothetical protein